MKKILASFSKSPFHLDDDALGWVRSTFADLDQTTKSGLVFAKFAFGAGVGPADFERSQPGFLTRMDAGDQAHEMALLKSYNDAFKVPICFVTDLEGSTTTPKGSTPSPNALAFGAANDPALTEIATKAMGAEAKGFGLRWSFTPAVDVNAAFRSSIVGTRSFGSDVAKVLAQGVATVKGLQSAGVAATAKHWPGEGYDERDQHLVNTVNPLSFADWEASFGAIYKAVIDAGVMSVMPAHIALPAYMKEVEGIDGPPAYLPGSLNPKLNENLLRGRLGFNGLIVSDATAMAGISGLRKRDDLVVDVLNAGCDVILGSVDFASDVDAVLAGLESGALSKDRLDVAVLRQLAFKAALGLHNGSGFEPVDAKSSKITEILEKAPTLVKTRNDLFPITPQRYKTIYLVCRGVGFPPASAVKALPFAFADKLRAEGFEVIEHEWGTPIEPGDSDLLLYAYAEECLLTRGTITNDWAGMTGQFQQAMKRHWLDTPTLMISFGWPYHLYEAPGVWGYINAYMAHPKMQDIVIEAMQGKRGFEGTSPVDPFCGLGEDYFHLSTPPVAR